MALSLTLKNLPEETVERLKARAKQNHRSLQGELRAILEEAAGSGPLTIEEGYQRAQARGVKTESSVELIRHMRGTRYGG